MWICFPKHLEEMVPQHLDASSPSTWMVVPQTLKKIMVEIMVQGHLYIEKGMQREASSKPASNNSCDFLESQVGTFMWRVLFKGFIGEGNPLKIGKHIFQDIFIFVVI